MAGRRTHQAQTGRRAAVRSAFAAQARACAALGSPFTAFLCEGLGEGLSGETHVGRTVLDWPGDPGSAADSVPLRLCGALHALVLSSRAGALAATYPPFAERPDIAVALAALAGHEAFVLDWLRSPPQTNETARAAGLWPMLCLVAARTNLPVALFEVGASAGLNLRLDRFGYQLGGARGGESGSALQLEPRWRGPAPDLAPVRVAHRAGCDIAPLDPTDPADALRLRAYLWPDQAARMDRLEAALDIARAVPAEVDRMDAVEWIGERVAHPREGVTRVLYSTVAWQYLPAERRDEGERLIAGIAAAATDAAPFARLRMETEAKGGASGDGAGLRMMLAPHGIDAFVGRADFHGRWVEWGGRP